ncbi:MAG TPA: hypothetical protein GXX76_06290 [Bacteroidales bacterium]|nr:hypothetical protein [Bacteroidales bacterium]
MNIDDIKIYLPKFLSPESEKELFEGLRDFPKNIDERLYTDYLIDTEKIYQGDGLLDLLVVNLPDVAIKPAPCMVFSNSCDMDLDNQRLFKSQIVYAPILNLKKYQEVLLSEARTKSKENILSHIETIRHQRITQIFYLPMIAGKIEESIVFLDRVCNMPSNHLDRKSIQKRKIFTLSDYGAYLFLLKLSIHFTRIQDNLERRSTHIA